MATGKVKWFNSEKGFGFIRTPEGVDCFVHHNDILMDGFRELIEDEAVIFDSVQTDRGFQAVNVRLV
jgi:cold shock protein